MQFSHSSNNPRDDIATEAYEDELDMGRSGSYLNSSINSAWSEHSLDPEDIRVIPVFFIFQIGPIYTGKHVWVGVYVFSHVHMCVRKKENERMFLYIRSENIKCRLNLLPRCIIMLYIRTHRPILIVSTDLSAVTMMNLLYMFHNMVYAILLMER